MPSHVGSSARRHGRFLEKRGNTAAGPFSEVFPRHCRPATTVPRGTYSFERVNSRGDIVNCGSPGTLNNQSV